MKRKGAPAKEGKCPRDAPKDQKCDNCRLRKGACQFAARIAAGHARPSPDEPSTSKPRTTQPVADSDMDIDPPNTRPSRQCQPPERIEVDDLRSRASGKRRPDSSCCSCSAPSTSEHAPKPKFTGPMDKFLSDKRVEAAVNRAVKSITDNPADLERELRAFAQTGEDWRQKSMTLEQEKEAIQKKLDKVTKELEKARGRQRTRSATSTTPKTTGLSSRRSSATAMSMTKAAGACYASTRLPSLSRSRERPRATYASRCSSRRP